MLGDIGRTKIYELFKTGELPSVTLGRRRLVPVAGIEAFARDLAA